MEGEGRSGGGERSPAAGGCSAISGATPPCHKQLGGRGRGYRTAADRGALPPPARGPSSPLGCRGGSPRFLRPRGTALLRLILQLLHRFCASQASCCRRGKTFCFTGPRGTFTHPAVVPSGRPAATRLEKDILSQSEVPLPPRLGFEIISVSLLL